MFNRNILKLLNKWKNSNNRKPIIIRGARQVGKTVVVNMLGKSFSNYVYLNLDRESDRRIFEKGEGLEQIIQGIELAKKISLKQASTLLFIDEIQSSPKAIKMLRYFYEDHPSLAVIAAGSLMEAVMKYEGFSFPAGRVEFAYMYPATFDEFLIALGEERLLKSLSESGLSSLPSKIVHERALELFHQYLLVGGMPEVVARYAEDRSLQSLKGIKEGLLTSFEEDTAKYSRSTDAKYLKHVIKYAPDHVGERIKYENFGNGGYRSREMKQAFDLLEYAMIVQRVHGSHSTVPPIEPNFNVSPKLVYVDVGLVAYKLGVSEDDLFVKDLNDLFRGAITEQVAGQTFCSISSEKKIEPAFWYRNKPGSTAETDYLVQFKNRLIPVEVKSGKSGSLKSLHQFILAADHGRAVRLYSGELCEEDISAGDARYKLLSVPLYLQWRLEELMEEWI